MRKLSIACLLALCPSLVTAEELKIASWNIANLHHENGVKMRPWATPREEIDYERLAEVAASVDADIFALQEIGSPRAAMRVFDPNRYHIVISDRYHEQSTDVPMEESDAEVKGIYTAFAIDKQRFPNPDIRTVSALSIRNVEIDGDGEPADHFTRAGLQFNFQLNGEPVSLLNVHLKSSCSSNQVFPVYDTPKDKPDKFNTSRFDCRTWLAQSLILENWIEQQDFLGRTVIVGGDFNRRFNRVFGEEERKERSWLELNDGAPNNLELQKGPEVDNTMCWNGHAKHKKDFIDFFIYNSELSNFTSSITVSNVGLIYEKEDRYTGDNQDRLSDHCPVVMTIKH